MGMHKYDRMMYILNSLRSRKNLSALRLSQECGVTERSIYRDILSLSEANVPIYYDRGYKLASDNFLPPLNFDLDEYNCLKMALDSSPLGKTDKYQALIKRIKAKVDAGLSDTVKNKRQFMPPPAQLEIPVTASIDQPGLFSQIEQAIQDDRCLEIEYDSIESGKSKRMVEPYFIVFRSRAFYFVAYCRKTNDFRTFRMDRISSAADTEKTFVRKEGINAESYFDGSWGVFRGERISVVVLFRGTAAKVVSRGKHHPGEQIERLRDGTVKYKVTT
ncbi:MAG TPA: WYL domain-containing protein, partial [candidate division Zixibacteria bacterium]|nr:WYL domain-containing protein [candidate division Zixibacteria bacterium]